MRSGITEKRATPLSVSALLILALLAPPVTAAPPAAAAASPTLQQVQTALADLDHWLGGGPNGQRWRAYLNSAALEQQFARGPQADPQVVGEVLSRFDSGAPGLQYGHFAGVRHGLARWLAELQQTSAAIPPRDQLPAMARAAGGQFRPLTPADVQQARARLSAAVNQLQAAYIPGDPNAAAWRQYILWDELVAQLQPGVTPDLQVLGRVYLRLTANHAGLELPVYRELADALRHYGDLAALAGQEGLQQWYGQQLERLATALEKYPTDPTPEHRDAISESIGRFTSLGLAPELVAAVRYHYAQPNLWATVSDQLLEHAFRDQVNRTLPVTDYILGTRIVGTGMTLADVDLRLVPDYRRAILETLLIGNVHSNTRGYNGPVVIHSLGNTAIAARKWIIIEPEGVRTPPATAAAVTNTVTTGIDAGHIARHIAQKRIAQTRGQANAIAARHAEDRLRASVNEEAAPRIAEANEAFQNRFRYPLLRKGELPELLNFSTTFDELRVVALKANRSQLGAPQAPPALSGPHDMTVAAHETMPNNMAEALLGGQTLQSEEVKARIIEMRGELPPELAEGDDEEPWSITFARRNPITTEFGENLITITIRGQRYTSGDRQFGAMNVSATYQIEQTPDGLRLVRQGEIGIFPPGFEPGKGRFGAGEVALRTILQRKFARIFPETVVPKGLELQGRLASAGTLRAREMQSSNGWLRVGWQMDAAEPRPPMARVER